MKNSNFILSGIIIFLLIGVNLYAADTIDISSDSIYTLSDASKNASNARNKPYHQSSVTQGSGAQGLSPHSVQDENILKKIIYRDGKIFIGKVIAKNDSTLTMVLQNGRRITLECSAIKIIRKAPRIRSYANRIHRYLDPNRTRYLYSPSAFMLRKGEVSFSQTGLLYPNFGMLAKSNLKYPLPWLTFTFHLEREK